MESPPLWRRGGGLHLKEEVSHHGWALLPGTGKGEMVPPTDPRHPGQPHIPPRTHRRLTTTQRESSCPLPPAAIPDDHIAGAPARYKAH